MQNVFLSAVSFFTRLVCVLVFLLPAAAQAQQCDIERESIFKLRPPAIGAYAIWYGVHGDDKTTDRYVSAVLHEENGHMMVAGTRSTLGKPYPEFMISEVDRRGRVVKQVKRNIRNLHKVLDIKPVGEDMLGTALVTEGKNKEKQAFWLGLFNHDGLFKREKIFRSSKGAPVVFGDALPTKDNKAFVMVLETRDKQSGTTRISEFYRLNSKFQQVSRRIYNPGPDNGFHSIVPLKDGDFLVSGYIDNDLGRKTGWLLKLDENGGIIWQRAYPRGISAKFAKAAEMPDGILIGAGIALPAEENPAKAGWLIALLPDNGDVVWQRYFTGKVDYAAKDLNISEDGLISLVLDATPLDGVYEDDGEPSKDYVRLLTLNPRGVIFDSQAFFQGEAADAQSMILGPAKERILIGHTQVAYQKEEVELSGSDDDAMMLKDKAMMKKDMPVMKKDMMKADEKMMMEDGGEIVTRSDEGWIVAAPRAEKYEDPCKPKKLRELSDLEL